MAEDGVPVAQRVFGEGDYLRPNFIQPYRCRNVLIEGVTIVDSPMWEIHPGALHERDRARRDDQQRTARTTTAAIPNRAATCSSTVRVRHRRRLHRDQVGSQRRRPPGQCSEREHHRPQLRRCATATAASRSAARSPAAAGTCSRTTAAWTARSLDRALRLKNNAMRGGVLEHIYMRDVTVGQVADSVLSIDFYYEEGDKGSFTPVARDIEIRHVTSRKSPYGAVPSRLSQCADRERARHRLSSSTTSRRATSPNTCAA